MAAPLRSIRLFVLAAALSGGLAGCFELGLVREVVFVEPVPGLPTGQPWVHLPVGVWMTEGGITARAISACFDPSCAPQAAVALFTAQGPEAARLEALAARPDRLVQALSGRRPSTNPKAKPAPETEARATPVRAGPYAGFALHIARRDGGGAAGAVALTSRQAGRTRVIVVVAASQDAAERIARDVATGPT